MSGNVHGHQQVRERADGTTGAGFLQHHIMTGIESLYEGITIATIDNVDALTPVVNGSAGNLVVAAHDKDSKRALVDGGFTRLFCSWDSAGSARYVINAAAWLCNFEAEW
mmetsp:Transcript_28502/g.85461  ORF Transcript_28502/g.85461 Transcript_28502/m.85461 type:complete len:110 (-) Transcript_28502:4662-4991(-)